MEIQGDDKHQKHMVDSADFDSRYFILYDGKDCLIRIEETPYKADKRKKEVDGRFFGLEYAHEEEYEQNGCAQKWRDAVDVHIWLL
jgi:hypothetical protein